MKIAKKGFSRKKKIGNLFVDCEWSKDGKLLLYQILCQVNGNNGWEEKVFLYFDQESCPNPMLFADDSMNKTIFIEIPTDESIIDDFLRRLSNIVELTELELKIHFYFAIKDIEYLFGFETIQKWYRQDFPKTKKDVNYIVQQRIYFGNFKYHNIPMKMVDLSGWSKIGGLQGLLNMLNIVHPLKNSILLNKKDMEDSFRKYPKEFLLYGYYDVKTLSLVPNKMCAMVNDILKNEYGVESKNLLRNFDDLPKTTGRLTAMMFEKFLETCFGKQWDEFQKIDHDISLTLDQLCGKELKPGSKKSSKGTFSSLLGGASIRSFGLLNLIIQGGRCINEQPKKFFGETVADVDIKSYYGTSLKNFFFPIGLPHTVARTKDGSKLTLDDFLKKYEMELKENLYTIVVSGRLSFLQNLIYSTIADTGKYHEKVRKMVVSREGDDLDLDKDDFQSDFVLMLSEIENGILTSDMLEILRKTCSSQEWVEILLLEVKTASMYRKSDFLPFENFVDEIKSDLGSYIYNDDRQTNDDIRSRKWTMVPLKKFIDPLLKKREVLKNNIKTTDNEDLKAKYKSEDTIIKLIVNSLYGIFCSSYFSIGNAILANNITCRARIGVWMLSRTFHGFQTITDGTAYSLNEVLFFKKNEKIKPGLATLSDLEKLKKHRSIRMGSLADRLDWKQCLLKKEIPKDLDQLAQSHLENFWDHYHTKFPYEIEHKTEHFGLIICFFKQAHYAILPPDSKRIIFKCRNVHRVDDLNDQGCSVFQFIMESLLKENLQHQCLLQPTHTERRIATLFDYFLSWKKIQKGEKIDLLRPGSEIIEEKVFRFTYKEFLVINKKMYEILRRTKTDFSNSLFPWNDEYILTKDSEFSNDGFNSREGVEKMFQKRQESYEKIFQKSQKDDNFSL